ncbi:MaoC family dehydratase [Mycolicibacterium sp. XJ1819]
MTSVVSWADLAIGCEGEPYSEPPLKITDFVRYQGASGDMNPIHHDAAFAKAAGYPAPFAVGMRQAGVLAAWVTNWFGASSVRRFGVRFREQAWPGDILTYSGRVTDKRVVDGERQADLELTCTRQTGGVHLVGWATVVVP